MTSHHSVSATGPSSHPKEVARRLGITTSTLYAYVNGDGSLKEPGRRLADSETAE